MFYRDVSNIPTGGCVIMNSSTALTHYASTSGSNIRTRAFELIGNKYIQRTDTTGSFPNNGFCQSANTLQNLQSNWDYIMPIYHTLAIVAIIMIIFLAYRLILYPFWRKRV